MYSDTVICECAILSGKEGRERFNGHSEDNGEMTWRNGGTSRKPPSPLFSSMAYFTVIENETPAAGIGRTHAEL